MFFPPFIVPYLGNGFVIGFNAVIHILISHGFGIGVFTMIMLGEARFGRLRKEPCPYAGWEKFNRRFFKVTVYAITIGGAVTGAGIWFTTTALSSRGIANMLHIFFWPWFIEYFTFLGEIMVLLVMYFKWDGLLERDKRLFLRLGEWYLVFSFFSAILITGILGFMLTPDDWMMHHNFWLAFLNPSFLPQLFSRLSFALILGSLIAMGAAAFFGNDSFRREAMRLFAKVLLVSTFLFALSLMIYLLVIPASFSGQIPFSVLTSHFSHYPGIFGWVNIILFLIILACAFAALKMNLRWARALTILGLVSIMLLVAQFERIREFIRGPYLMPGYMYANEILLREVPLFQRDGLIKNDPWSSFYKKDPVGQSALIFARNCMSCHTIGGLNDIRRRLKGRSLDGIYVILNHTHVMVPFMPPLAAGDEECRRMSEFLFRVTNDGMTFQSLSRAKTGADE